MPILGELSKSHPGNYGVDHSLCSDWRIWIGLAHSLSCTDRRTHADALRFLFYRFSRIAHSPRHPALSLLKMLHFCKPTHSLKTHASRFIDRIFHGKFFCYPTSDHGRGAKKSGGLKEISRLHSPARSHYQYGWNCPLRVRSRAVHFTTLCLDRRCWLKCRSAVPRSSTRFNDEHWGSRNPFGKPCRYIYNLTGGRSTRGSDRSDLGHWSSTRHVSHIGQCLQWHRCRCGHRRIGRRKKQHADRSVEPITIAWTIRL